MWMRKYIILTLVLIGLVTIGVVSRQNKPKITNIPTHNYVALGDSVAAGVGLKTDSDSSACNRTNQSYPNLIAQKMNFKINNLACSGATLASGILGEQEVNQLLLPAQLDQLYKLPFPSLITITIGANDVKWTTVINKCYTGVCGNFGDTEVVNQRIALVSENLRNSLIQIQTFYKKSPPHVVVSGYNQVFPVNVIDCPDLTGIDQNEINWVHTQQVDLNKSISSTVGEFAFAKFASIDFTGHELCTTNSWVQGIADKQPYHPTEEGQMSFANQIVKIVRTFK